MKDLLDYADVIDYFEEEDLDTQETEVLPQKPNTMHLRENTLARKTSRRVQLGQTAHCAWFLTKGFAV